MQVDPVCFKQKEEEKQISVHVPQLGAADLLFWSRCKLHSEILYITVESVISLLMDKVIICGKASDFRISINIHNCVFFLSDLLVT